MTDAAMADPNTADSYSDAGFGDTVASESAQNDFLRARAAALDDGMFRLQGGEAVAAAPAAANGLQDLRDALLDRAGSVRQRALLAGDLDAHLELAQDVIARHVARQTQVWDQAVRAERIGLLQDQARRDWADPDKLALYGDAAASVGSDDPDAARSGVWRSAIDAALTQGQHGPALDLHEDAADHLTPEDAAALAPELAIAKQMQTGREYVAGLLPGPMPATPAKIQAAHDAATERNAADWADDPEQQATNQHLIDVEFGTQQRQLQQADIQRAQTVQDWLARRDANGNLQTERPPPSLWKQLDADERLRVDTQLAQNARGEVASDTPATDRAVHQDGAQFAKAEPPGAPEPPVEGTRGIAPATEPPPNDPETEKAFQEWPGVEVVLGNGERIPDPKSPTGHVMAPFNDLDQVAAVGREIGAKAKDVFSAELWRTNGNVDAAVEAAKHAAKELTRSYLAQGGAFDYQRRRYEKGKDGFTQLRQFRSISNVNVGLLLHEAFHVLSFGTHIKFDKNYALQIAGEYARGNSSNYWPGEPYRLDPETRKYIETGYDIGLNNLYHSPQAK